jgi:hypothetical protein
LAIDENYRLLGHWYSYIYVPRNEDPGSKKGVVKKDD